MAIAERFKGLFRKRALKELEDPEARRRLLQEACDEASQARALDKSGTGEWRSSLRIIAEAFQEVGQDETELYRFADAAFPDDEYWLSELVKALVRRDKFELLDLSYLEREAARQGMNLSLWRRLLEERRRQGDQAMIVDSLERVAIGLGSYFPSIDESEWLDVDTESEARSLFYDSFDDALESVLKSTRSDPQAEHVLMLGSQHFPERAEICGRLAELYRDRDDGSPKALEYALRGLLYSPEDVDMKLFAGRLLCDRSGHEEEGMEMLRQVLEARPDDPDAVRTLGKILVQSKQTLNDEDAGIVRKWHNLHTDDVDAAVALADFHANRGDIDTNALEIYRKAVTHSPNRAKYLRLIGKSHASQGNWTGVIDIFDKIHEEGDDSEDTIIPLATAYAEMGRIDDSAVTLFQQAIQLGSRHDAVHNQLCRHLYQSAPQDPASIRQFKESLKIHPDCMWARLGVIGHLVRARDFGKALDEAAALLKENGNDIELQRLAAESLAGNFHRLQVRKVISLPPKTALAVLEQANQLHPDALPITSALVRSRLANNVRDMETAKMLGEICRRDPDEIELRIARADLLWELDQRDNAAMLYKELIERWRAMGGVSIKTQAIVRQERARILHRVAEFLMQPPGPKAEDMDILLEAALDPEANQDLVLAVARHMVETDHAHPMRLAFLERALAFAPGDELLERAVAESRAARGNPRPALKLGLAALIRKRYDASTVSLLRAALSYTRKEHLGEDVGRNLDDLARRGRALPEDVIRVWAQIVAIGQFWKPEFAKLMQRAVELEPNNPKLAGSLARCYEAAGEDQKAAELYRRVVDLLPEDDETVLSLARTHARLQRNTPEVLELASRAYEIAPEEADLGLHLAAVLLGTGQTHEAADILDRLLGEDAAVNQRVLTLLEQAAPLSSNHAEILLLLSKCYVRVGKIEQALVTLVRLHTQYTQYMGDLMACYDEIIRVAPDNARAHVERAILYKIMGQVEEAAEDLAEAAHLAPNNQDILEEYEEVLEFAVNTATAPSFDMLLRLTELRLDLENAEGASEIIDRALEMKPKNRAALLLKVKCLMGLGQHDEAHEAIRNLTDDDTKAVLLQSLSRQFEESHEYLRAAEVLTEALEISPDQRDLLERLRNLHVQQAREQNTTTDRQRILGELSPSARSRYEIRERLGKGAMGEVFLAYDRELDELVVLKILGKHFAKDPAAHARFKNEAKAARKLSHPNIVRIHDIGEEGGLKHISMEYVPGGDLRTMLQREKRILTLDESISIIRQIARALVHAHGEGVLHRDIKPANILIGTRGKMKLSDFGIAAIAHPEIARGGLIDSASQGTIFGTPIYMSPEHFAGDPLSVASDIYSLGILFYELITGLPPFCRGSVSYHHQYTKPAPLAPEVPGVISKVIFRCVEKKPERRYQSAVELLQALDEYDGIRRERGSSPRIRKLKADESQKEEDPV
ncbi:protein kinase [bacterium]|nr:protein kinase [bacterium]